MKPTPLSTLISVPKFFDSRLIRSSVRCGGLALGDQRAAFGQRMLALTGAARDRPFAREPAHLDRVQAHLPEPSLLHFERHQSRRPPGLAVAVEPGMQRMVGRMQGRQPIHVVAPALVAVVGDAADELRLREEIADAVDDRLALVDLDPQRVVPAMADVDVGAGVDRGVRELAHEHRRLVAALAVGDVEMVGDDDEVGHLLRLVDRAQIAFQVALVAAALDLELVAGDEHVRAAGRLLAGHLEAELVALEPHAARASSGLAQHVELARYRFHLLGRLALQHVLEIDAQRIDAGPAAHAAFREARPFVRLVARGGRDERDPAMAGLEVSRLARFLEVDPGACHGEARRLAVPDRGHYARLAEIHAVVVRERHDVDAGPFQIARDLRVGHHEAAQPVAAARIGELAVVPEVHFEMPVGQVRGAQEIDDGHRRLVVVHGEGARHQAFAGERYVPAQLGRGHFPAPFIVEDSLPDSRLPDDLLPSGHFGLHHLHELAPANLPRLRFRRQAAFPSPRAG